MLIQHAFHRQLQQVLTISGLAYGFGQAFTWGHRYNPSGMPFLQAPRLSGPAFFDGGDALRGIEQGFVGPLSHQAMARLISSSCNRPADR